MEKTAKWWVIKMHLHIYDQMRFNGSHQEAEAIFLFGEIGSIAELIQKEILSFYHSGYCEQCEYDIPGEEKCDHQKFFSAGMKGKQITRFAKNAGLINFYLGEGGAMHIELHALNNDGTTNLPEEEEIAQQISSSLQRLII